MKNRISKLNWNYEDKNLKNKFLKLLVSCTSSVLICYLFNIRNFDKANFIFSIIFGIIIWVILLIQRKI